jgi:hypothetical protein
MGRRMVNGIRESIGGQLEGVPQPEPEALILLTAADQASVTERKGRWARRDI